MTAVAHPDITCTKCDSVVPWGPHCPQCRAYLEFSGEPAWHPDVEHPQQEPQDPLAADGPHGTGAGEHAPEASEAPEAPEASDARAGSRVPGESGVLQEGADEEAADQPVDEAVPVVDSRQDVLDSAEPTDSGPTDGGPGHDGEQSPVAGRHAARGKERRRDRLAGSRSFTLWQRGWRRQTRRNLLSSAFAIALAVGLCFLFVSLNGTMTALAAAPLLALWAFLAVAFYGTIPDQREFEEQDRLRPEPVIEPDVDVVVADTAELVPEPIDDDGIRSRAPQTVADMIEKSKPLVSQESARRDSRCDECGHMNLREHRYCEACTSVMSGSRVYPAVVAYISDDDQGSEDGEGGRGRGVTRRRINGSWRNVVFALMIIGVIVGAFAFAFFGPGAFRLQVGMTQVFQAINQWIDPYAGRPAGISSVTASSTLPGTKADSLKDADARTFWASDVLPEFGTGSWVKFTLDDSSTIDRMVIYPGVQNNLFDRRALATPREITLKFDDGTEVKRTLNSLASSSDFRQLVNFPNVTTTTVTMTINTVYLPSEIDPSRQGEVAISGAQFLTKPVPPSLFRFQSGTRTPGLPGVESN